MKQPAQSRVEMADRRRLAVERVAAGRTPADVADFLGLNPETVRRWVRTHKAAGAGGLAGRPHPGRRPFLTPEQDAEVLSWLTQRPTAFGFRTDLWTAARVAQLIRQKFGVEYHPGDLREWLTRRGQSPQKPALPARQRNPAVVGAWLAGDYPAAQKKPRRTTPTSS